MVMVVAYPRLVARRRPRWLEAAKDARINQCRKRVVHRLLGNGTDIVAGHVSHNVSRDMGLGRDGMENRNALGGHLDAALS
jgi:hypothetical protein